MAKHLVGQQPFKLNGSYLPITFEQMEARVRGINKQAARDAKTPPAVVSARRVVRNYA